ncbi:hypothetical protein CAEBREN_21898 [Caenorhabditis brenneri]|uniref:Uncharacterized protein n=1 Tax=Caenorhabditis brenneri TaxID=135651 RepID=G0MYD1_CAEBE|nr:hypothetical protein CAEBREN_21898 [Caenorhabditis brenneri]
MSSALFAPRETKIVVEVGDSGNTKMPSFPPSWKGSGPTKTVISIHLKKVEETTKVSLSEKNDENYHIEKTVAVEKMNKDGPMAIRINSGNIGGCKKAIASKYQFKAAPKRNISPLIQSLMYRYTESGNSGVKNNYLAPIPVGAFSGHSSVNVKGMAKEYEEKIKALDPIDDSLFQRNNWSRLAFKKRNKDAKREKELVLVHF